MTGEAYKATLSIGPGGPVTIDLLELRVGDQVEHVTDGAYVVVNIVRPGDVIVSDLELDRKRHISNPEDWRAT